MSLCHLQVAIDRSINGYFIYVYFFKHTFAATVRAFCIFYFLAEKNHEY